MLCCFNSFECISLAVSWEPVSDWASPGHWVPSEGYKGLVMSGKAAGVTCTLQASSIQLNRDPVILLSLQSQWREQAAWSTRRTDNASTPFPTHRNLFLIQMLSKRTMNFNTAPSTLLIRPSNIVLYQFFFLGVSLLHKYLFFKHFQVSYYFFCYKLVHFPAFIMPLYHCVPLPE